MSAVKDPPFTRLDETTAEQWHAIAAEAAKSQQRVADNLLAMLRSLASLTEGFPVNQLEHALQTAALAERDGADEELIVAALCHDVGILIEPSNHALIAAEILKPFVRKDVYWVVRVHQEFQGRYYFHHFDLDRNISDRYKGHPAYAMAERFSSAWDQRAFDPGRETPPLEHYEPMLRKIFARKNAFTGAG
jgi:predicted HD phosphohydrolase